MPDFSFPPITTHGKTHSAQWAKEPRVIRNVPWSIVCAPRAATRPLGIGSQPDQGR
ncbi:hypothetical protein BIFCAT_00353 [Bifidobacterium catenulatum DSM 16992 = JCM 1194 = LMG 11043]|uniref:Uncharacterized protein n=1 Tax=Bifidobacterium catenulatum DSM 16992 = JCM 1194 = LMG 11043 TaxID=566552 RepID=B6XT43_9BIFI|nr:hypothetical protein BIFCAT_00353 [Bifidobacterium catenulatum DSM 16992 = JCM 1194 = LMG 11043]